jgi:signal transduction histidine kinase
VKHANASHIGLRVVQQDGHVLVHVSDDGKGGATLRHGSGLADRVAALGGSLAVNSPVGRGTIVEAALPCAS